MSLGIIGLSVLCMSIMTVFRLIIMCHISDQGIDRRIINVHYCDYDDDDFFNLMFKYCDILLKL